MGCGASSASNAGTVAGAAGSNATIGRPAPLEISRPAGEAPRRGSDAAERAEAAAEAAASPTSGERTRWQAVAARQQEARDQATCKLQAIGIGAASMGSALSKAELPVAEEKLSRAEAWLRDLDERAADKEKQCERAADECAQLQELKSGARSRADMQQLLMSIATRASETCAAAEEHAVQTVAALREPTGLQGLMEIAAWQEPPGDARSIFQAASCLLTGVDGVATGEETAPPGKFEWASAVCGSSGLLADPAKFVESLSPVQTNFLKATADGQAPQFGKNATQARALMGQHVGRNLAMDELDDVQSLQMIKLPRNRAVALVCRWVVAHLAYQDAQLLLEESAGEAAFELKAHELSKHRGLHAALLAQRQQASIAVTGQTELVAKLRATEAILALEEAGWGDEKTAQVENIIAEYRTMLQEHTDEFQDDDEGGDQGEDATEDQQNEGEGEDDEDEDDEDEDEADDDEEEQVRAGAAALIQSRARGNIARKRVEGLKTSTVLTTEAEQHVATTQSDVTSVPESSSVRTKSRKQLAIDTEAMPNFESLGPIPEPGMESGVLTVDVTSSPPEAVAAAAAAAAAAAENHVAMSAAEKKAEFQKALQEFNGDSIAK
eukprot:COSAG02_NODE_1512_length_12212_cov_4.145133_3_plen_612_part_00